MMEVHSTGAGVGLLLGSLLNVFLTSIKNELHLLNYDEGIP